MVGVPANQTAVLCGLRADVSKTDLEDALRDARVMPECLGAEGITKVLKDKKDSSQTEPRRLVFLNCKSKEAAKKVCAAFHQKKSPSLGMQKVRDTAGCLVGILRSMLSVIVHEHLSDPGLGPQYGTFLQAVLKTHITSLDWTALEVIKKAKRTVEGDIAKKTNAQCFIEHPISIVIPKDAFEGNWEELKEGDVIRVVAEHEDGSGSKPWKATEAILVNAAPKGSSAASENVLPSRAEIIKAEAKVLADAEEELGRVLSQKLMGKGWVPLKSVGGWFNQPPAIKEALDIVKTKHLQLKNFIASSALVEMKQDKGEFLIALAEDMQRQRAAKEEAERKQRQQEEKEREARVAAAAEEAARAAAAASAVEAERIKKEARERMEKEKKLAEEKLLRENEEAEKHRKLIEQEEHMLQMKARVAAQDADIATGDETQEEQDGRARCYRIQRAVLELSPMILSPVLQKASEQKYGEPWSPGPLGSGAKLKGQIKKISDVEKRVGKAGISKLAAGSLDKFDLTFFALLLVDDPGLLPIQSAQAQAVKELRKIRNALVHELHLNPALLQEEFEDRWQKVMKHLEPLAKYAGNGTDALLQRESQKILDQGIDAKKQAEYACEFNQMLKHIDERQSLVEEDVAAMKSKMMTESRIDAVVARKVAAMLEQQRSASASVPAADGQCPSSTSMQVKLSNGKVYAFDPQPGSALGEGNQGSVYKAQEVVDGFQIALKLSEMSSTRQQREYINLDKVRHPNVVEVLGHGIVSVKGRELLAIGMEFAVGKSYDQYLKENNGRIDWRSAAPDFRQIVAGMQAVHEKEIIHRDLKPANIVRTKKGGIVIVDFGLSKDTSSAVGTATQAGAAMGTPAYMAPEVRLGSDHVTFSTDVFGMGVILYEALSGCLPWNGVKIGSQERSTAGSLANTRAMNRYGENQEETPPSPLLENEAPASINKFVLKCIAASMEGRFQRAGDMLVPWDEAVLQAEEEGRTKAERSDANAFWQANFRGHEEVRVDDFEKVFREKFELSEAAGKQLAFEVDEDNSGTVTHEEFLSAFSEISMQELAKKYEQKAASEAEAAAISKVPENVFFDKRLVCTNVRFKSKGTLTGISKERVGTLTLEHGNVVAHRFEDRQSIQVFAYNITTCVVNSIPGKAALELRGEHDHKGKTFYFQSQEDCDTLDTAIKATVLWMSE